MADLTIDERDYTWTAGVGLVEDSATAPTPPGEPGPDAPDGALAEPYRAAQIAAQALVSAKADESTETMTLRASIDLDAGTFVVRIV